MPSKPWILTYTGRKVDPLNLRPEDVCLEDIAHALACVNRFAGHTAAPINVAQHSVYVSRLCGERTPESLQALLHDASEAYLGDVTKWLKATPEFAAYREAEDIATRAIFEKFGCAQELDPMVERADRVMVMYEAAQGFGDKWDGSHLDYSPISVWELHLIGKWAPWGWRISEESFLERYRSCTRDL